MNEQEWMEKLKSEGYKGLKVFANEPNALFGEHTHHVPTVHVILSGELIVRESGAEKVMKKGERFEFAAGTTHTAQCGLAGCTMIVGMKAE